jgi:hypothetical protein
LISKRYKTPETARFSAPFFCADKLGFMGGFMATARSGIKVSVKPFQRLAPIQRAERWSPLASGETPYR